MVVQRSVFFSLLLMGVRILVNWHRLGIICYFDELGKCRIGFYLLKL